MLNFREKYTEQLEQKHYNMKIGNAKNNYDC